MSDRLERAKPTLARKRIELLRRETAHVHEARRILGEIESSDAPNLRMLDEARRAVELAEQAQRVGIVDAHRVGATPAEIADVTGIGGAAIAAIVGSGG